MNKDSKIYVAGHRGLVGSALLGQLKALGYKNILQKTHQELDLIDPVAVEHFFQVNKPEYVFLAAAYVGGIMANSTLRADFIYRNMAIEQNVISAAYRHKVKKLMFLGSTCIYPKDAPQPIKEEYLLTSPLEYSNEPYAIAKIAGLKMCESFNLQYGTDFISVMPTNLYGPRDNFDLERSHVLPAMIRKILLSKALLEKDLTYLQRDLSYRPLSGLTRSGIAQMDLKDFEKLLSPFGIHSESLYLWGSGTPLREFLWSEDMANACIFLMEKFHFKDFIEEGQKEIRNTHINIGSGKEISIRALAELIALKVDYPKERLCFDSSKPDGVARKLCDPSRIHRLGWHHQVELEDGVERLLNWYLEDLHLTEVQD